MSTAPNQDPSRCDACGSDVPTGARFCPGCGSVLAEGLRAATAPRDAYGLTDPLIGQVIAERYRVLALLGRGGMGVVYRVEHVHIGKLMAMKLLSGELARDATTLARFEREAKAVSHLSHPNTVQIFDFGQTERLVYLVMEYVPGRDLATVIAEEGPLSFERVARIGAQIAGSVEEAHQRGIIHRDIKPENVMVLDTSEQLDFVKVLDFGIAKLRDAEAGSMSTQKGHMLGTPYYMAPEQIRAGAIDHRVDVYALGGLMYKALTGVTPFHAETPMEVLGKHLNDPVIAPSVRAPERAIPREADRIISRALAKDPDRRYPSMAALREELLQHLDIASLTPPRASQGGRVATRTDIESYEGTLKRRMRWYVAGAAAMGVLMAAGGYAVYRARSSGLLGDKPLAVEQEPNDEPAQANLLGPGLPLRALQGKRRSATESDADVFRVEIAAPQVADITVSALPNVDLLIELMEKGSSRPFLVVDTGNVGVAERIPNLTLQPGTYYMRVRQPTEPGVYPVENVSDAYVVSLALGPPAAASSEHELNDGLEVAETLLPFVPREGLIGWARDRDVYCAAPDDQPRTVTLTGVPGLNLVLTYLDRATDAGQRIDRAGVGEGESLTLPRAQTPRRACLTVSAREGQGAERANPTHRYRLELR